MALSAALSPTTRATRPIPHQSLVASHSAPRSTAHSSRLRCTYSRISPPTPLNSQYSRGSAFPPMTSSGAGCGPLRGTLSRPCSKFRFNGIMCFIGIATSFVKLLSPLNNSLARITFRRLCTRVKAGGEGCNSKSTPAVGLSASRRAALFASAAVIALPSAGGAQAIG
jgi:hypothetical protein